MGFTRKTAAAATAGVLVFALAGCGDDGDGGSDAADEFVAMSVEEIKEAVLEDMKAAESLRLSGTFTEDGEEISLDMGITTDGECAGSLTAEGATAEIISGSGGTFLKGDQAFWEVAAPGSGEQMMQLLGDKWALVPAAEASSFSEFCDLQNFIEELEDDSEEDEDAEKGETEEIDGQEALEILGEDDETGETTHVWVATGEPHYILKVSSDSETDGGEITFSEYDEPVDTEAPAEGEYVDLSQES